MRGNLRFRLRSLATALLATAAIVLVTGLAGAAWDGTQRIRLGDKVGARFGASDARIHEFSFYAPKDTVVTVKAKAAAGMTLAFEVYNDRMVKQDLGTAVSALGIKAWTVPADSKLTLHVARTAGSGAYLLTTSAKFPTKITGDTANDFQFGAVEGAVINAVVKPAKGSTSTAVINKLTCPGDTVSITAGGPSLSKVTLPDSATFTLDLAVTGGGNVTTTVSIKSPKSKDLWSFDVVDTAPGSVDAITAAWMGSGHANPAAEAFHHWDAAGVVDATCAKCHTGDGMLDWLGATGRPGDQVEVMDFTVPTGQFVACATCHSAAVSAVDNVLFPSGNRVSGLGAEARCMECHQGLESTTSVNAYLTGKALDTVDATLSFKNVHYFAAAATLYGRAAAGAYQYAGKVYNGKFSHVESYDNCIQCHDQHSTEVRVSECSTCHTNVVAKSDLRNIRMNRSVNDYNGNGNTTEGIAAEVDGLAAKLYAAIQDYGTNTAGKGIVYSAATYPYWFNDNDASGTYTTGDTKYTFWTPRLLEAAYDYQFYVKDPGAFAHNSRYVIEILYDSIESINQVRPVTGFADLVRTDANHFDATSMAYRDWDSTGMSGTSCSQCHTSEGFKTYVANLSSSGEVSQVPSSPSIEGMPCESCHEKGVFDATGKAMLRYVPYVFFPSNRTSQTGAKKLTNGTRGTAAEDTSFICLTCHQGRNSKQTIDDYFLWNTDPTKWSFQNVHYAAAGAMLYGKDAQVGYEYTGQTYVGQWVHGTAVNTRCNYCHMQLDANGKKGHGFVPKDGATCAVCHGTTADITQFGRIPGQVSLDLTDYNGNGDTTETLEAEVETFADRLYERIQAVATANGFPIVYDGTTNPYFFNDANANGVRDTGETSYSHWTQPLMKAAHNYQFWFKETAGWAHNRKYVMELLYDSIVDLGGDVTGLTRP